MLQNGTNVNGVMIEKPHRFLTAMTIATQLITAVSIWWSYNYINSLSTIY